MKKIIYITIGCTALGLGAVGAVIPVLPTFPFLMLAAYCFAGSSEKLSRWFVSTKLYKNNLESYAQGKGMTARTKMRIMTSATLLMGIGFVVMFLKGAVVGCVVLGCVWLFHIVYFLFGVKTLQETHTI